MKKKQIPKNVFMCLSLMIVQILVLNHSSYSQNWNQIIKQAASDRIAKSSGVRSYFDYYGYSVAIDGNYAVVGAIYEDEDTIDQNTVQQAGAAFVLYNNSGNWTQIKKLVAPDRLDDDNFGYSVAISGNYIIVGAPFEDEDANDANSLNNSGSAYIFKKNQGGTDNWGQIKKICAATRADDDNFGISVGISGDYAIVGSNLEDEDDGEANTLSGSGSAYVFKQSQGGSDNWGQIKKITASTRSASDNFGISVAINGSYAIVGANQEDEDNSENNNLSASGSAYLFKVNQGGSDNWGFIRKITAGTRAASDNFGISVSIYGDYALVGANLEDEDDTESNTLLASGSAYIFKQSSGGSDNWGQIKKLTASSRLTDDLFGTSVSIQGDYAIVGAHLEDQDSSDANTVSASGSAHIFKMNQGGSDNWGLIKKRTAPIRTANDQFGNAVAISGSNAIVGARQENENENEINLVNDAGSAFIFNASQNGSDVWGQVDKVTMFGRTGGDTYGYSVSIDGNYAIVGAYNDQEDANGANPLFNSIGWGGAGSAYILKFNGSSWSQIKKLAAPSRAADDWFGYSVSIQGDYAIVGAVFESQDANETNTLNYSGSAYIFKKNQGGSDNWGFIKKLTAGVRAADDGFGNAVSIYGDYAIVGAPSEDEDANDANTIAESGSAYIFKKDQGGSDNWGLIRKITAANRASSDNFGTAVSITSGYAIVGASYEDHDINESNAVADAGSAFIFKQNQGGSDNWGQVKKLVAPSRTTNDWFGGSVAISPTYAVVGAYFEDEDENDANTINSAGSAYIFKVNQGGSDNWGQIKKITANTREDNDNFGFSVAINGNYIVVGAFQEDEDASDANTQAASGSAYLFKQDLGGVDNWGQVKKLVSSTRTAGDAFGTGVAISNNYIIVGSGYDTEDANEQNPLSSAGSAYIFRNGCTSSASLPTTANTTYTGSYNFLDETGWTHVCSNDDKLLLSLKIGTSGADISASNVQLKLGSSTTFSSSSSGGMISNTNGYALIDRRWDVVPNTQPSSGNVGVKYYFTANEYSDVVTALGALTSPSTVSSPSQLNMYKATSGSAFADPHTVNGIIIINGATPSTTVWKYAVQGSSDHSAEFEVSSFSGGGGGGGGGGGAGSAPLPVSFTHFSGKVSKSDVNLNWITANEVNNSGFEIERSKDGKTFETIGFVKGNGNSNQILNYYFTDKEAFKFGNVRLFYRLKQIDFNGEFMYSKIIKVDMGTETLISEPKIGPNPFNNSIQIVLSNNSTSNYESTIEIEIYDLYGTLILSKQFENANKNGIMINTESLGSGMYILSIKHDENAIKYRMIKN